MEKILMKSSSIVAFLKKDDYTVIGLNVSITEFRLNKNH